MYTVLLCGGIASGKSTVSRMLRELGARVIDLDEVSREVTVAGSPACARIAQEFGEDVLDARTGELRRDVLARRAFASTQATRRLEEVVHPAIRERLFELLTQTEDEPVTVVEVPLLDRVEDLISQVDEVLCVWCPLEVRRERAIARGMDVDDFCRRVDQQTSDEYLSSHASTLIANEGDERALHGEVQAWWDAHESRNWKGTCT